jgi:heterodisulfide reductase subunit D
MQRIKELKGDIYKCIHCKACRFAYSGEPDRVGVGAHKGKDGKETLYEGMVQACPAGIEFGWEAYWNAGKIWIARAILEGELDLKKHGAEISEVVFPCITCGLCGAQCENDIKTVDIIEAIRGALIEAGNPALKVHQIMANNNDQKNNPYGGPKEERIKWSTDAGFDIVNKDTKIAYYVGCTASYRQTNVAVATVKLLQKIGFDITILDKESCCGSPFFRTGLVDEAQRTMNDNIALFKDFEIILFSCAGCYRTFTIDYPKWTKKENTFKTMHAMELVSVLVRDNKIKFKEHPDVKGKVATYHDPCHTGRHYGQWFKERLIEESTNLMMDARKINKVLDAWFEVPRRIIKAIPGLTFNEMYRIKMDSFCCGAGGGVRGQYPEFSVKTAHLRCDEANAVKADYLLTECPFCWRNLDDANTQYKHGMKVMTILELISTFDLIESYEKVDIKEALRENNAEKHLPHNLPKKE